MCWTPLYANKQTQIRHEHSYKQLEVKDCQVISEVLDIKRKENLMKK